MDEGLLSNVVKVGGENAQKSSLDVSLLPEGCSSRELMRFKLSPEILKIYSSLSEIIKNKENTSKINIEEILTPYPLASNSSLREAWEKAIYENNISKVGKKFNSQMLYEFATYGVNFNNPDIVSCLCPLSDIYFKNKELLCKLKKNHPKDKDFLPFSPQTSTPSDNNIWCSQFSKILSHTEPFTSDNGVSLSAFEAIIGKYITSFDDERRVVFFKNCLADTQIKSRTLQSIVTGYGAALTNFEYFPDNDKVQNFIKYIRNQEPLAVSKTLSTKSEELKVLGDYFSNSDLKDEGSRIKKIIKYFYLNFITGAELTETSKLRLIENPKETFLKLLNKKFERFNPYWSCEQKEALLDKLFKVSVFIESLESDKNISKERKKGILEFIRPQKDLLFSDKEHDEDYKRYKYLLSMISTLNFDEVVESSLKRQNSNNRHKNKVDFFENLIGSIERNKEDDLLPGGGGGGKGPSVKKILPEAVKAIANSA